MPCLRLSLPSKELQLAALSLPPELLRGQHSPSERTFIGKVSSGEDSVLCLELTLFNLIFTTFPLRELPSYAPCLTDGESEA